MDIQNAEKFKERFESDFQKYLTPENTFFLNTKGKVSSDVSVNVPQYLTTIAAGHLGTTALDQNVWSEDNKVITQKRFRTQAYQIDDYKEFFTAQDMRGDAMDAIKSFLDTAVGNYAAYQMGATAPAHQLFTTGATTSGRATSIVGSSATVQRITLADMLKVRTLMGKSNLPGKWYGLMDPAQIEDLLSISSFTDADKLGIQSKLVSGQFADILGIKIFERSPVLGGNIAYGGTAYEIKDIYGTQGAADAVAATDVSAAIFWNDSALYSNRGMMKTYIVAGDANFQSDILSAQYSFGLDKIRKDGVGVIALIETTI